MSEIILQDLIRRMDNLLRAGTIAEVNHDKALVRVKLGEGDAAKPFLSGWLNYFAKRAGNTIDWDPPEVGEQCLVLSPGGEMAGGFALTGIYSNYRPAPSKDPKVTLRKFSDGLECSYDQTSHTLTISRSSDLKVIVKTQKLQFSAEKVAIKNAAGSEVLSLISDCLQSLTLSTTATMMGPQKLLPAATELPSIRTKLSSFLGA